MKPHEIKSFCIAKDTFSQLTEEVARRMGGKLYQLYIQQELISRIYKEFKKLDIKANNSMKR